MKTLKNFIWLFAIFFAITIISSSCKKKDPQPEIPPQSTFLMNFNDYSDTTIQNKITHANWIYGAANVGIWNVVITIGLAIPVASYAYALQQEPKWDRRNRQWVWSYNFTSWGVHSAKLTAELSSDTIIWNMKIDDFDWYTGHSHTNGSGGYWILNESRTYPTQLLRIDWALNSSGVSSVKYTNVAPSTSPNYKNNGEYITYGTVASAEFNRFYNIFLKNDTNTSSTNLTQIEWNFSDKHGHVKDQNHFGDANWHCWNNNLEDITCP